jgi:mono/diheme cytochrome c family protein
MNLTALRAAVVIAAVYGNFLIFAQFAFVELLRAAGVDVCGERLVLGVMAVAGIGGGFFAAWRGVRAGMLRIALGVAGVSAAMAPFVGGVVGACGVALASGAALGVATVNVAAMLPGWCAVAWVGLGTGLGYACCNLPWVFNQSPAVQAWVAAGFALVGLLSVPQRRDWLANNPLGLFPWWAAIGMFAALVWLDSAAFFIIQHVVDFKSATWGDGLLWRNAVVHLVVALAAGCWLARAGARLLPVLAWLLLALAATAVNATASRCVAGWAYPAAVSLYSTALVAWAGWFAGATGARMAAWRAAGLFAVAGWFASANGIGMAQSLNRVPGAFVAVAGMVVIGVAVFSNKNDWRAAVGAGLITLVVGVGLALDRQPAEAGAVARGRQVYLAEGCINCHSQYIRPGSGDELLWGQAKPVEDVRKGLPVLIGNRRQGPDISTVGARRSAAWLRVHFLHPRLLVPGTAMPSYTALFANTRGEDLIAYLQSTGAGWVRGSNAAEWCPAARSNETDRAEAARLFARLCAACHGREGRGDGPLAGALSKPPVNLVNGPFVWSAGTEDLALRLARVIKFGIPGTDMAGHETLADAQIEELARLLVSFRAAQDNKHSP